MEHGAWSMEHGAWSMEHGAWSVVFSVDCVKCKKSNIRMTNDSILC